MCEKAPQLPLNACLKPWWIVFSSKKMIFWVLITSYYEPNVCEGVILKSPRLHEAKGWHIQRRAKKNLLSKNSLTPDRASTHHHSNTGVFVGTGVGTCRKFGERVKRDFSPLCHEKWITFIVWNGAENDSRQVLVQLFGLTSFSFVCGKGYDTRNAPWFPIGALSHGQFRPANYKTCLSQAT